MSLLRDYAAAFRSKNLSAVATIRDLNSVQRRRFAEMFSENEKVDIAIVPVGKPQFEPAPQGSAADSEPGQAVMAVDFTIRVRTNNGQVPDPTRARATIRFTRTAQSWRISSWE